MSKTNLIQLSADEFYKILKNNYLYTPEYKHFHEFSDQITFKNVAIDEDLLIKYGQGVGLYFENCRLLNITISLNIPSIQFINTDIESIELKSVGISKLIIDKDCNLTSDFRMISSSIQNATIDCTLKSIEINSTNGNQSTSLKVNRFLNSLVIEDNNITTISSNEKISLCRIKNSKYPFKTAFIKDLEVEKCDFQNGIVSGVFGNITLNNCERIEKFFDLICIDNLLINDLKIEPAHVLYFSNVYVGGKAEINNFRSDVVFSTSKLANNFVFINELKVSKNINNLNLKSEEESAYFYINSIAFKNFTFSKEAIWKLEKLRCCNLLFDNFRNFGTGNIDNTIGGYFQPLNIGFDELINLLNPFNGSYTEFLTEQRIINYESKKERTLTFNQSDFGKLNFINTDFSDFKLYFYSTKLNEIFLAGSRMPKNVEALEIENVDLFHQQRLANTQLKKLHELHGDVVAANEYFANEMNAYYSSLKWRNDFWEKLQLWFNKISSNHAQSWKQALLMTFGVSVFLYIFFCLTLNYTFANPLKPKNWSVFWNLESYYWDFLSPVHKVESFNDLISGNKISPLSRNIDNISRIINSYFIYQLIQAFRKHSRSK